MEEIKDFSVLKPERLGYHFMEICKRAHISAKEDEVRQYLKEYARGREDLKLVYYNDNPTTDGEKNVIIQGHALSVDWLGLLTVP